VVYKLAQIPPDNWMTLSINAKKWLLNERKSQQQEDDRRKRLLLNNNQVSGKVPDKRIIITVYPISMQESKTKGKERNFFRTTQV
jgi:hypothetical protein